MIKNETVVEYIADLIRKGFVAVYYPYWKLSLNGIDYNELDNLSLRYIAHEVADGFTEGEIIVNCKNCKKGWWDIEFV